MPRAFLGALLVLFWAAIPANGVIDCRELNFSELTVPTSGSDLLYCSRPDTIQCCTDHHLLEMKANITEDLISGTQEDLGTTIRSWMDAYSISKATISEFLSIFVDIFPFPHHVSPVASYFLNNTAKVTLYKQLHPEYKVDLMFDFESYIANITGTLIEIFTQNIDYKVEQKKCLQTLLHDHVSNDSIEKTAQGFRHLQFIFQSLSKVDKFLSEFQVSNSTSYYPSEQCLEAIVMQYCPHCVQHIPPLCGSTCVQLASACQSPLYESLLPQFNVLWNISRQLVLMTQSLMNQTVLCHTVEILSPNTLHSLSTQSLEKCGINLLEIFGVRRKRSVDDIPVPNSLQSAVDRMSSVEGVFSYTGDIPSFCLSRIVSTDCWNGSSVVRNDSILNWPLHIKQQNNNSAFNYNIYEFYRQAALLQAPIVQFIKDEDFIVTLPTNISIPVVILPTAPPPLPTTTLSPITTTLSAITTSSPTTVTQAAATTTTTTARNIPTIVTLIPSTATSRHYSHTFISLLLLPILLLLLI